MREWYQPGHDKIVQALMEDPRVLSGYSGGTTNTKADDEYSDVDSYFVARDETLESLRPDIATLIEGSFPDLLMLACYPPTGPADNLAYHFMFQPDQRRIGKYDLRITRASDPFLRGTYVEAMKKQLLFDKTGTFPQQLQENQSQSPHYDPTGLRLTIERYWQAVLMQVKFLKRRDPFKLEYVQNGLFQTHIDVLRALFPEPMLRDWWARGIRRCLPDDQQQELLLYLDGLSDVNRIAATAGTLIKRFDSDARQACKKWAVEYPEKLSARIMRYFVDEVVSSVL